MARSDEIVRQWQMLRAIEASRYGETVRTLASGAGCSTRTVWRDLAALTRAGFPLYDEKVNGTTRWKLSAAPFKALAERGLTLTQVCSLYFSRTLADCLVPAPFRSDLREALEAIAATLAPGIRRFLDRLPVLIRAKATGVKKADERRLRDHMARLIDAVFHHRRVGMRYSSMSSRRTARYVIEPHGFDYALGGLYLSAYVPAYGEVRTFAVERIRTCEALDERFEPPATIAANRFAHSLGVHSGEPESIVVEFTPDVAPYVAERTWHASQTVQPLAGGGLRVSLHVCRDAALRAWILSFGPDLRVVSPRDLADDIARDHEQALEQYDSGSSAAPDAQPLLPFVADWRM